MWEEIKNGYQVSNEGIVINSKGKIIIGFISNTGYRRVSIWNHSKMKHYSVHRLVAEAFIPNPENKPEVNHKDTNKLNNNDWNLEWSTSSENKIHASINNTANHKGINNISVKLNEIEVLEIRKKHKTGNYKYTQLSKEYGVNPVTISYICRRKLWKHI